MIYYMMLYPTPKSDVMNVFHAIENEEGEIDLSRCKPVCNLTKNTPLNSGRSATKTNSLFVLFKWLAR